MFTPLDATSKYNPISDAVTTMGCCLPAMRWIRSRSKRMPDWGLPAMRWIRSQNKRIPDGEMPTPNLLEVSPTWALTLKMSAKQAEVGTTLASFYGNHLQVAATAGGMEPFLDGCIGDSTFHALPDTGAGVNVLGARAIEAARSAGLTSTRGIASCSCQACAEILCLEGTFWKSAGSLYTWHWVGEHLAWIPSK